MSIMQIFRDGYHPRRGWKRIAAWIWLLCLGSMLFMLVGSVAGWKPLAVVAVAILVTLVSVRAIKIIARGDR